MSAKSPPPLKATAWLKYRSGNCIWQIKRTYVPHKELTWVGLPLKLVMVSAIYTIYLALIHGVCH